MLGISPPGSIKWIDFIRNANVELRQEQVGSGDVGQRAGGRDTLPHQLVDVLIVQDNDIRGFTRRQLLTYDPRRRERQRYGMPCFLPEHFGQVGHDRLHRENAYLSAPYPVRDQRGTQRRSQPTNFTVKHVRHY